MVIWCRLKITNLNYMNCQKEVGGYILSFNMKFKDLISIY
jgi:hypothetical protein